MGLLSRIGEPALHIRLDVVRYARRHGLTAAVNHFQVSGWKIQRWVRRFTHDGPSSLRFGIRTRRVRAIRRSPLQLVRPMRVRMGPFPAWGPVGQAEPYEDTRGHGSFFDLQQAEGSFPAGDMSRDSARLSFDYVAPLIQRATAALGKTASSGSRKRKYKKAGDGGTEDRIQELVSCLRGIAEDPALPESQREAALELTQFIEEIQESIRKLEVVAEMSGLEAACETIDNDRLAKLLAKALGKGREGEGFRLVYRILSSHFQVQGWPPGQRFWDAVHFGYSLLQVALTNEFDRRQAAVGNKYSNGVRDVIVEEGNRGDLLQELGKDVAKWRSYSGERPQPNEDDRSMEVEVIWEQISPFTSTSPSAANPEFLVALIRGDLKRLLQRARDSVWLQRRRERKYSEPLVEIAVNDAERGFAYLPFCRSMTPNRKVLTGSSWLSRELGGLGCPSRTSS